MRAWIISNGVIENHEFYQCQMKQTDLIICADGGMRHAQRIGVVPHVLIGDLDSIQQKNLGELSAHPVRIIQYSTDKDQTDTQLAVEYALKKGCTEIIMIGSLGGRFDHAFANVSLLKKILDQGCKGKILSEKNEIHLIDKYIKIQGRKGATISLLPMSEKVEGVSTKGLYYALNEAQMVLGMPNGISNVFLENEAEILIRKGLLLVIKSED